MLKIFKVYVFTLCTIKEHFGLWLARRTTKTKFLIFFITEYRWFTKKYRSNNIGLAQPVELRMKVVSGSSSLPTINMLLRL